MEPTSGPSERKVRKFSAQSKEIIYNVFTYMKKTLPNENKTNLKIRVSEATGVCVRSVERIIKEEKEHNEIEGNKLAVFAPPKRFKKTATKTDIPDYEKSDIRSMIYNFHKTEGCRITMKHLQNKLEEEYEWTGSCSSLRRITRSIGFRWRKTRNNRPILVERHDIRALRLKYLEQIKFYRNSGRSIVFLDETYVHAGHTVSKSWSDDSSKGLLTNISKGNRLIMVHAGGEMGFIPNALLIFKSGSKSGDYHDDMNSENYEKWLKEKLIPNLPPNSIVVTDNAPYHNKQIDKAPTSSSRKCEMVAWLECKKIAFQSNLLKPQLYEIIKNHKRAHIVYKFDRLLLEHGHIALRLPPYHPDLNPIESIWGQVKNNIARRNVDFKLETVKELAENEFSAVTVDDWKKRCRTVIENEDRYLANERQIDIVTEDLIINLGEDSSSDDDSSIFEESDSE